MKDQILAKIKKIIWDSGEFRPIISDKETGEIEGWVEITSANLDHIIEEIEGYIDFFTDNIKENTLQEVLDEVGKTKDYIKNVIDNIKKKNNKKLERSEDEN